MIELVVGSQYRCIIFAPKEARGSFKQKLKKSSLLHSAGMAAIDAACKKTAIYQGYQRSNVNNTPGPVVGQGIAVKCQPNIFREVLPIRELSKIHKQNGRCMSCQYGLQSRAPVPRVSTAFLPAPTSSPISLTVTPRTSNVQNIPGTNTIHTHNCSEPSYYNSSSSNLKFFSFVHSPRQSPEMRQPTETSLLPNSSPGLPPPETLSKSQEIYIKVNCALESDHDTQSNRNINRCNDNTTCYNSSDRDQPVARKSSRCGKTLSSEQEEQLGRLQSRRNLSKELMGDLTFKPTMNQNSIKIVNRTMRHCVPLEVRLMERKKKDEDASSNQGFTFCPKINANSIKMIHDRACRLNQGQVGQNVAKDHAAKRDTNDKLNSMFKYYVSTEKSIKIAETLHTAKRQEIYLEGRKKYVEVSPIIKSKVFRSTHKPSLLSNCSHPTTTTTTETETVTSTKCRSFSRRYKLIQTTTLPSLHSTPQLPSPPLIHPSSPPLASKASLIQSHPCNQVNRESSYKPNPTYQPPRKYFQSSAASPYSFNLNGTLKHVQGMNSFNEKSGSEIRRMTPLVKRHSSVKQKPLDLDPVEMKIFSSLSERDKLKRVRLVAERKIKEKKVFLFKGGYHFIRRCLRKRGWVELNYHKAHPMRQSAVTKITEVGWSDKDVASNSNSKISNQENSSNDEDKCNGDETDDLHCNVVDLDLALSDEEYSNEEEYTMLSRTVRNATPNLVWSLSCDRAVYDYLDSSIVTNHFSRSTSFTTKVGICTNLRNLRWYGDTDPDTFFPRCYQLTCNDEKEMFIEDFRFTAAVAILKMVSDMSWEGQLCTSKHNSHFPKRKKLSTKDDKDVIPKAAVQLALRAGEFYMGSKKHFDVESSELHLVSAYKCGGSVIDVESSELHLVIDYKCGGRMSLMLRALNYTWSVPIRGWQNAIELQS